MIRFDYAVLIEIDYSKKAGFRMNSYYPSSSNRSFDVFPGHGVLQEFFDNTDGSKIYTPVEVFRVSRGKRYRFRTISNGILNCPIQVRCQFCYTMWLLVVIRWEEVSLIQMFLQKFIVKQFLSY